MSQSAQPRWIARADVECIHQGVIDVGGGSRGLRDGALLESALARPRNLHAYGETDTFQLAASYAEGSPAIILLWMETSAPRFRLHTNF